MTTPIVKEHSFSIYDLEMRNLGNSKGEDLFKLISGMPRAIVDNNTEWKSRSLREPNRAFLLGRTLANETPNLEGLFFNQKVTGGRLNVFVTDMEETQGRRLIVIHRLDPHFKATFSGPLPRLDEVTPAEKANWNDPLARLDLRDRIAREVLTDSEDEIRAKVARQALLCFGNYNLSCLTASLAYGLLLVETFDRDRAEVKKFLDNHENVFGDTALVQEALLYAADLLSNDGHVKTMAAYCGRNCIH